MRVREEMRTPQPFFWSAKYFLGFFISYVANIASLA
jgi:hypothetical protein